MLKWFADRLAETGKEARKDERGFTLIELLVVVIIIGILAAIAIPTFLSQRTEGFNADAQTTARNAATAAQTFFVQNQDGTISAEALQDIEPTLPPNGGGADYQLYEVGGTVNDFRIRVQHAQGDQIYTATEQGTDEGSEPPAAD